ncbi:MAG: hypothetical protein P8080_05480 [Gammaproteobacteria bacterium]
MTRRPTLPAMALLGVLLVLGGCDATVNEDIRIPPGATEAPDSMTVNGSVIVGEGARLGSTAFRTVNGRIHVGNNAVVGDCGTVNGRMEIGSDAVTGSLQTVNGSIRAGSGVRIDGDIEMVNGDVWLGAGTAAAGDVITVNGEIEMTATRVEGDVSNVNGDMLITDGSVVTGKVRVRKAEGNISDSRPVITIGPQTRILGGLEFERPVTLYVHETAEVGDIDGAEPVRFSGERPGQD